MSKIILVIDKPLYCGKCKLFNKDYYCCQATRQSVYREFRSEDCPLKNLPQHKITDLEKTVDYACGWEQGYNACIDEILGEKNNE